LPLPDTLSHPNDVRQNNEGQPSHAADHAASGSSYEDDPSLEVQADLAASGMQPLDAHEATLQEQADLGPHHEIPSDF
jgi:hypothetical protein